MKHGTTNNGYTLSTLDVSADGTRLRQTQTPDVADNSYVCSLPLVAPGAAHVWKFCLCLEILSDSLFFVTVRDPSICPGFQSCCFLSVRAAPGVRHSSCVPAANALASYLRCSLTIIDPLTTNRRAPHLSPKKTANVQGMLLCEASGPRHAQPMENFKARPFHPAFFMASRRYRPHWRMAQQYSCASRGWAE